MKPGRLIAIGDIHGCSTALARLLDEIAPRPEDTIVTLGDYVNRGPDSRGVIERLMDLGDKCTLIPLLGNHDEVFLEVLVGREPLDQLLSMGGEPTLESYGYEGSLGVVPPEHVLFLASCRLIYETDSHFFAHANYAPNASSQACAGRLQRNGAVRADSSSCHGESQARKGTLAD